MANRNTRKSTAPKLNYQTRKAATLPGSTAVISYIRELPGAVFFGDAIDDDESIDYAVRLQRIRASYEHDDCQEMLWHDLSQMGFDSKEIRQFVTNPAAITNCGYGMPIPLR
jgi:hypothetical protein